MDGAKTHGHTTSKRDAWLRQLAERSPSWQSNRHAGLGGSTMADQRTPPIGREVLETVTVGEMP